MKDKTVLVNRDRGAWNRKEPWAWKALPCSWSRVVG